MAAYRGDDTGMEIERSSCKARAAYRGDDTGTEVESSFPDEEDETVQDNATRAPVGGLRRKSVQEAIDELNDQVARRAQASRAIEQITREEEPPHSELWLLAAEWTVRSTPPNRESMALMRSFGYKPKDSSTWEQITLLGGDKHIAEPTGHVELRLHPHAHVERAGHTWYLVECMIYNRNGWADRTNSSWRAPRRLSQLRALHDVLKENLGAAYDGHFRRAQFASHGGPPGTTGRLNVWLGTLARLINECEISPANAAMAFKFFGASTRLPDTSAVPLAVPR